MNYKKIIYVAGKFQNNPENKKSIESACTWLYKKYNREFLFVNGVDAFGFYYDCTTQREGHRMCKFLLDQCDAIVTIGDYESSVGTYVELMIAEMSNKPIFEKIDCEGFDWEAFEDYIFDKSRSVSNWKM